MAIGKNKGLAKKGGKGKKKAQDPFLRKVWYDINAPNYFAGKKRAGRTMVTKTTGQKIETDGLRGRIAEFNLADLHESGDLDAAKKVKLEVQEPHEKSCLTDFHGLSMTRDKLAQVYKKKHTLVEAWADAKTSDGYVVRVFIMAITKELAGAQKQFTYAQTAQVRKLRKRIQAQIVQLVQGGQLSVFVKHLINQTLEDRVKKQTGRIYPLDNIHVRKVKVLKKPKLDVTKLMENHKMGTDEGTAAADNKDEPEEAKNLLKE